MNTYETSIIPLVVFFACMLAWLLVFAVTVLYPLHRRTHSRRMATLAVSAVVLVTIGLVIIGCRVGWLPE